MAARAIITGKLLEQEQNAFINPPSRLAGFHGHCPDVRGQFRANGTMSFAKTFAMRASGDALGLPRANYGLPEIL